MCRNAGSSGSSGGSSSSRNSDKTVTNKVMESAVKSMMKSYVHEWATQNDAYSATWMRDLKWEISRQLFDQGFEVLTKDVDEIARRIVSKLPKD